MCYEYFSVSDCGTKHLKWHDNVIDALKTARKDSEEHDDCMDVYRVEKLCTFDGEGSADPEGMISINELLDCMD